MHATIEVCYYHPSPELGTGLFYTCKEVMDLYRMHL